jgi:hypothetical protein
MSFAMSLRGYQQSKCHAGATVLPWVRFLFFFIFAMFASFGADEFSMLLVISPKDTANMTLLDKHQLFVARKSRKTRRGRTQLSALVPFCCSFVVLCYFLSKKVRLE